MIGRLLGVGLSLAVLACAPAALADGMTVKNAQGQSLTLCTKTASTVEHPCHLLEGLNTSGAPASVGVGAAGDLFTSPKFGASGVSAVTGAVASSTLSSGFTPTAGRTFYLELTGTGSVTGTVVYLCNDGSTYAPNVVATDGGSPTIMDKIAYSGGTQNGVRIALQVDQAGMSVKFSPGTVTGTVNYAFVQ